MKKNQLYQDRIEEFTLRWKTLCVCYDTTIEDVKELREEIENFVEGQEDVPDEFFMLLNDLEDWLVARDEEFDDDESSLLTEDDVYRKIAQSAFAKIKNEWQDEEWDEDKEDTWLLEIFNMMIYLNEGDSNEVVAHKIFNELLQASYEVELQDLIEMVNLINSLCKQELMAVRIAGMAFELGALPEIALVRVREILSLK